MALCTTRPWLVLFESCEFVTPPLFCLLTLVEDTLDFWMVHNKGTQFEMSPELRLIERRTHSCFRSVKGSSPPTHTVILEDSIYDGEKWFSLFLSKYYTIKVYVFSHIVKTLKNDLLSMEIGSLLTFTFFIFKTAEEKNNSMDLTRSRCSHQPLSFSQSNKKGKQSTWPWKKSLIQPLGERLVKALVSHLDTTSSWA